MKTRRIATIAMAALCVVCAMFALSTMTSCRHPNSEDTEHAHTWDGGVVAEEPACTEEGSTLYTCEECGEQRTEAIAALGHDYAEAVTYPTCAERGYTTHTCSRCGDEYTDAYTDALGHDWELSSVAAATCTEGERNIYVCAVCGETYAEETGSPLGHTPEDEPLFDEEGHWTVCAVCGETISEKEGHVLTETVITAADCEERGSSEYACLECGYGYTAETSALGHGYEAIVTDPTCTEGGYTTYTCSRCGDTYEDDYTDALGHTFDGAVYTPEYAGGTYEHVFSCTRCGETFTEACSFDGGAETVVATCTDEGETTYTCAFCGGAYTEPVEALGHDYEAIVTDPACTEGGYTAYTCSRCGDTYEDEFTDALGHTFSGYGYDEDGHWSICSVCGESYDAGGHEFDEGAVTDPDCTEGGYTTYTCSICGETYDDDYTDALGHDYEAIVTDPACTEGGYTTYTCSRCGDEYLDDYTEALGHTFSGYGYDEDGHWSVCAVCGESYDAGGHEFDEGAVTDPDCTEGGYTTYTCLRCGDTYADDYTDALGHDYAAKVTAATCAKQGYTTYTCSRCGDTYEDDYTDALGHSFTTKVTAATCTTQGYTRYTCSRCGLVVSTNFVSATGHSFDSAAYTYNGDGTHSNVCTKCGETVTEDCAYDESDIRYNAGEGKWEFKCEVCGNMIDEPDSLVGATLRINADTVDGNAVAALSKALTYDGVTVKLEMDVTMNSQQTESDGADVTLDLNGYTLMLGKNLVNSGTLTITDGSSAGSGAITCINSVTALISNEGTLTITGGTFTANTTDGICVYVTGGTVEISGGIFDGCYGVCLNGGSAEISGGTFTCSVADVWSANEGDLTVNTNSALTIGGESAGALNLTLEGDETYLTLVSDLSLGSALTVAEGQILSIDLGNFVLTVTMTTEDAAISNRGTLNIRGGASDKSQIAVAGATKTSGETLIYNAEGAALTIKDGLYEDNDGHIVENYGTLEITGATLKDSNYSDSSNVQVGEDESHSLIENHGGDVTLKEIEMDAYECGVEMFGGSLTISGGTYATPYEMSTNASNRGYFYYIVYAAEGTSAMTVAGAVTFKDGIGVAYGAALDLTVSGTLTLDDYYEGYGDEETAKSDKIVDGRTVVDNYGTMTITGSGTIEMADYGFEEGESYKDSDVYYFIRNYGDMTIDGVTISSPYVNSSLITNGWNSQDDYDGDLHGGKGENGSIDSGVYATLTIEDGTTITGGKNLIKNDYDGVLYINGGTFTALDGAQAVICNQDITEIKGGAFDGRCAQYTILNKVDTGSNNETEFEQGVLTITDGKFKTYMTDGICVYVAGGTVEISGGTFAGCYGAYLDGGDAEISGGDFTDKGVTGYTVYSASSGTLTVSTSSDITIGAEADATLDIVLSGTAAKITITPLTDITMTSTLYVAEGKALSLDLGSYALTLDSATSDTAVIENHGTLYVTGGSATAAQIASKGMSTDALIENYGVMTLTSLYMASAVTYGTMIVNGSEDDYENASLTIEGGDYVADRGHILVNYGTLSMDTATLEDKSYSGTTSHGYSEDEDNALINMCGGSATLTGVTMYALECGIDFVAGDVTLDGGTYATTYQQSTNASQGYTYFYYIVYVPAEGEATLTIEDTVTFKDGMEVAYGGKLDLTVDANSTLLFNAYYPDAASGTNYIPDARILIENYGEMTIGGEGTIKQDEYTHVDASSLNASDVTYLIRNFGDMTISSVTVTTPYKESALITNGWNTPDDYTDDKHSGHTNQSLTDGDEAVYATLTIESGTFTGGKHTVKNDYDGYLIIEDGTFTAVSSATSVICNQDITEIKGGEFEGEKASYVIYDREDNPDATYEQGNVTISGGRFFASSTDGICVYVTAGTVTVTGGSFGLGYYGIYLDGGDAEISRGSFTGVSRSVYSASSGTLTVSTEADTIKIGADTDATLDIVLSGNATIMLLTDITMTSTLYIAEGQTLDLDLGSYALTLDSETDDTAVIENHGSLNIWGGDSEKSQIAPTVSGATLIYNADGAALTIKDGLYEDNDGHIVENYGTLKIERATLKDSNYSDSSNVQVGEDESHSLIENHGGDVMLTDIKMYAYECGVEMLGGSLAISGGTFATPYEMSTNTGGYYYIVYAAEGTSTMTVTGSVTFKDSIGVAYGATLNLTMSSGTLTLDAYYPNYTSGSYYPDGRCLIENYGTMAIEGSGTLEMCNYGKTYGSDAESRITADSDVTYLICNYGTMTISGVTVSSSYVRSALIHNGWQNKSSEESDSHKEHENQSIDGTYATLTIESGTFTGGKHVVKSDYGGELIINGGEFYAIDGSTSVICSQDIAYITGGTFDGEKASYVIYARVDDYDETYEQGKVTISGGTFTADTTDGICVYVTGGTVEISGGAFTGYYGVYNDSGDVTISGDPVFYTANGNVGITGYAVVVVSGTLDVSCGVDVYLGQNEHPASVRPYASDDGKIYLTFSGSDEITVTLLGDVILGSSLRIGDTEKTGTNVKLVLDSYSLTLSTVYDNDTAVIVNYGTATIEGDGIAVSSQIVDEKGKLDTLIENYGTMYLTSLRIESEKRGIVLITNHSDAGLYICGCILKGTCAYVNENGGYVEYDENTDFGDSIAVTDNGDGSVEIKVSAGAALATAFAYGADEVDVVLEDDITLGSDGVDMLTVEEDAVIEVDLSGHILTTTQDNASEGILVSGTLTIKDTSADGTGKITGTSRAINVGGESRDKNNGGTANDATLIIESGTIEADGGTDSAYAIRCVGGTVVIEDGVTITATSEGSTLDSTDGVYGIVVFDDGELVINGGTITAEGGDDVYEVYGIGGNAQSGGVNGTTITISGNAEIFGRDAGIYHPQAGELTISGKAKISGADGIEIRNGHLTVSSEDTADTDGVQIISTADALSEGTNNNGTDISGAALAISDYDQEAASYHLTVMIYGGTFTANEGCYAIFEKAESNTDGVEKEGYEIIMTISGGTFVGGICSVNCKDFISGGDFSAVTNCICMYIADGASVTCPLCDSGTCTCGYECKCGCNHDIAN